MWFEESLIFFPTRYPQGQWNAAPAGTEDLWFEAEDATRLHGWFVPHPDPVATVVFAHGNAGNLSDRGWQIEQLRATGANAVIFDYRGYGRSEGRPSEAGILRDARGARLAAAKRADIDPRDVVLLGRSLGGAAMVDVAAELPTRGLVLECTFTSIPDVAAHHFPWLPVRPFMRTQLNAAAKISRYHGPLLASHGTRDTVVPYELGQRLFEQANQPKRFITLSGADHNEPPPASYYTALAEFLRSLD